MDLTKVEKAWRAMWMRAIGRSLPGPRVAPGNWDGSKCRTLFVRYERIGDMIMATGIIRVLAGAMTSGKVDVLANPSTAPVLYGNPYVGKIFTLDRKSWKSYVAVGRELRGEKYDVVVDGRINNPAIFTSTPLLMLASRAPYRVGVGGGNNDLIYNVRVPTYDRATPYIQGSKALALPFGVDVDAVDWRPEIFLGVDEVAVADSAWAAAAATATGTSNSNKAKATAFDTEENEGKETAEKANALGTAGAGRADDGSRNGKRLLVNLSASEPKRRWQDEKFIEVLGRIRAVAPGLAIAVIGLPSEWQSVERVAGAVRGSGVATPTLRDALALVGASDMVLTPDTSISHAASAFNKPAVVLLKRDHHPYAPYDIPGEIIHWEGNEIHSLPSNSVTAAVERMVRRYGPG